jgi:succinyl-diaminopimelate desuccinylase
MTIDKHALVGSLSDDLILNLTARMVAIPTRNPPGEEKPCADFIYETLTGWGIEAQLVDEPDPLRPQVVAWIRGTGDGPTFILNGHIDTVAEGDPALWSRAPFRATREGDRLYGLGTSDMKGSLASCMAILKAIHDARARFPGTLMFQAAMGEEMDEPGTKTLLQSGYTGDWAITMEPTDSRIGPGTRGVCWHRVELMGPSSHCGLTAADAPDVMHFFTHFAAEVETYHQTVAKQTHHLLASPACRITTVKGGEAHNSTARRCEMVIDRRMLPHESPEEVATDLRKRLEKVKAHIPEVRYGIEFIALNEATETPLDSPLVKALQRNYRDVRGVEAKIWGPPYGSDMRNFIVDAGIPTVNFGAGDFHRCHQPDEFVPVDDLLAVARVVFGTVIDFLESDSRRAG